MTKLKVILFCLLLGAVSLGCAGLSQMSRVSYVMMTMADYKYTAESSSLVTNAKKLLIQNGYDVRDVNDFIYEGSNWAGGDLGFKVYRNLVTEWRGSGNDKRRYFLYTNVFSNGKHSAYFYYETPATEGKVISKTANGITGERDYDLEYQLLKSVDPDAWTEKEEARQTSIIK
ncbi:MAG: hypothetical protein J6A01_09700 [Proteobacteria bacterium]|nr:hypothetical protein [Pseudomonadota bacterium]